MKKNYRDTNIKMSGQYPGLLEYLGSYIRKSAAILKNPKQLLPTAVLGAIWLVLGVVGANFRQLPLPLWILSFLTYAQGGLYGGLLAAAGGIVGKVVIAAFLNAMIVPVFQGQKPFAGVSGGVSGLLRGTAVQGLKEASPLTGGAGAALILYGFMNSRQDMQEAMVGIAAIIMLLKNIGAKSGFMTGLLFSAAQIFSGGRVLSRIIVDRILSGLTIGFTLAVALTLLPSRPCVWIGLILLMASIVLAVFGKKGSGEVSVRKQKKGQMDFARRRANTGKGRTDKLNQFVLFLLTGTLALSIMIGNTFGVWTAEIWSNPWTKYNAKDITELYPQLRKEVPLRLRVTPEYHPTGSDQTLQFSNISPFTIDLSKDAVTEYRTMIEPGDNEDETRVLVIRFTGDPAAEALFRVDIEYQIFINEDDSEHPEAQVYENCTVYTDSIQNTEHPQSFGVENPTDCDIAFHIDSISFEGTPRGAARLDFESYLNDPRYSVVIGTAEQSTRDLAKQRYLDLGIDPDEDSIAPWRFTVYDTANGNREVVHQEGLFVIRYPQYIRDFFPEGGMYPGRVYEEYIDDRGEICIGEDNHNSNGPFPQGEAGSRFYHKQFVIEENNNGKKIRWTVVNASGWNMDYGKLPFSTDIAGFFIPTSEGTMEEQKAALEKKYCEKYLYNTLNFSMGDGDCEDQLEELSYGENSHVFVRRLHSSDSYEDDHEKHNEDRYGDVYLVFRELPEVPYCWYMTVFYIYGRADTTKPTKGFPVRPELESYENAFQAYLQGIPQRALEAILSRPLEAEWLEPVWNDSSVQSSGSSGGGSGSIGGSLFDTMPGTDNGSGMDSGGNAPESKPAASSIPQTFDYSNYFDEQDYHGTDWDEHADVSGSFSRTIIGWFISMLFGGGFIGGAFGGGAGGALGGAAGGSPAGGPDYGRPDDFDNGEPVNSGETNEAPPSNPYDWNNPLPKGIYRDFEGNISYKDPATGESMNYTLTGYDPETGEPQYRSDKSGFEFGESDIRENYDNRSRNKDTLGKDAATGRRWAEEQRKQNQAKWDRERETGRTDATEGWKKDQEKLRREQYRDRVAEQYGRSVEDVKGIKKDILKNRQKEAEEYGRQMAKDDWLGAAEDTASQIETASDIAINALGEVTGPAGKAIKNAYTFAKPGMTKLSESLADGKDVYETMTAIAQGTAEGAIGVLQNEVDGIGMAVGGDLVKTGLDGVVNGKSMDEIAADLVKTGYESGFNYGIGQVISSAGKKAGDFMTSGLKDQMAKTSKTFDRMGAFGNMAGDKAGRTLGKQKLAYQKAMNARISNMKNWSSAATNLFSDIFQKTVTNETTELIGDAAKADTQHFINDAGELFRKYRNGTL